MSNKKTPYILGETAFHHEGDFKYLNRMTDDIAKLGLDGVKFHLLLNLESYMQDRHPLFNEMKKWIFTEKQWSEAIKNAQRKKLEVVALCNDVRSVEFVRKRESVVVAIELHGISLNDYYLLDAASRFKGIVILGIGGSTLDEISYAVNLLKNKGKNEIMFMYGFQSYPTDYSKINLSKMVKIGKLFDLPVGYADHTSYNDEYNEIVSVMGAMMGVNILEKHYTPELGKERIDFHSAAGKEQILKIKKLLKLALEVSGTGLAKMSKEELDYGKTGPMKKAIVAKKNIKKGERISFDNTWFKRTKEESYVRQMQLPSMIGLRAINDINKDNLIVFKDLEFSQMESSKASFTHKEADK